MKRIICALCCAVLVLLSAFTAAADRGTPEILPEQQTREASAIIRVAGDFVIHQPVFESALRAGGGKVYEFSAMLEEVAEYLSEADFTVTNIDGVLGTPDFVKKHGIAGYPSFSTPANLAYDLKECGVDLLTLANNHALDFWFDGLKSTVTTVKEAGLYSVGGYRTQEERNTPCTVDINGIRFGFLNYTDGLNQMDKRPALDKDALKYGVCFTDYWDVPSDVRRLKDAGAEIIVCFMHWGIEYRTEPCKSQLANAQLLADAGVNVIIGGHPHVVERAEYIHTKDSSGRDKQVLCLFSLGNFLSDQRAAGRDCGMIFEFTVTRDENGAISVSAPVYRTTYVWRKVLNAGGYAYKVLFSDWGAARPDGMSQHEYGRMLQSALDTDAVMSAGVARHAEQAAETDDAPELRLR